MIERCKSHIDKKGVSGALLADLSKAFDCLPHKLMVTQLFAYGFEPEACRLVAGYFTNRKQRVNVNGTRSGCQYLT
jgi:hypothetical protein